ncbi:MAG: hypothetical protein KBC00_03915 [Candidatus Levybacteria bacterium]|nr:hypothetical protein [Candidatus Levybacteria bacterium]MBP9815435.1 hypothetical protein [Candidatus Levybacteria bacterium]
MDENLVANVPTEETNEVPKNTESLLDRVRSKMPDASHFARSVLIPIVVVLIVISIGSGGTYLVASDMLNKSTETSATSRISESDIPVIPTIALPTSSIIPSPTPDTALVDGTPPQSVNPTASPAAGWSTYTFAALNLTFSYPPGWYVNLSQTSGAPYLYVQNFPGNIPIGYTPGQFAILIARLEQVGIVTVDQLISQLALNAGSSTFINGVNMGTVNVNGSTPTTVNGYQALERSVTYSSSPSAQVSEVYVLDGVSNVVEFVPLLDTPYGSSYFNTLLSTIQFSN